MFKRVLTIIVAALLLMGGAVPARAAAMSNGKCGDNLTWMLDGDGTLIISGSGKMDDYSVFWEAGESGASYCESDVPWNQYSRSDWLLKKVMNDQIRHVSLPDGITRIGANAFNGLHLVNIISIPSTAESIGKSAFSDCTALQDLVIPFGVKRIEDYAFEYCDALTNIVIPPSVSNLGQGAFQGCGSLKTVSIPISVISIGYDTFGTCIELSDIYFEGTQEQWEQLENGAGEIFDKSASVTIHYNSTMNELNNGGKERLSKENSVPRFTDVSDGDYFCSAIEWAVENGITNGTSETTFSPLNNVTRAQAVTFLWRSQGSPAPRSEFSSFNDVMDANSWYYKSVLWAIEQGITNGTTSSTFSPDENVTRGQMVAFLYRAMGEPHKTGLGQWYTDAESWAARRNLLTGTTKYYSTNSICPRGDVVYYLWNCMGSFTAEPTSSSAIAASRYDFVISDCSWSEAFKNSQDAGGHLARIETKEEYDLILTELTGRGLTNVDFRIGARRDANGKAYHWVDSDNHLIGDQVNSNDYWANAEFLAGEPSFQWKDHVEQYLSIYFDKDLNQWVWNDTPDQVYTPGQEKYGYIIEYGS